MLNTMSFTGCENLMAPLNFSLFAKLPLELRRKVWTEALPASRTISLKPEPNEQSGLPVQLVNMPIQTPNVFHVNNEARTEAFMTYKPAFQTLDNSEQGKCAYVDFNADTVYCHFNMAMSQSPILSIGGRKRSVAPADAPLTALETLAMQEGHHIKRLAIHFGAPFSPWFTVDVAKPMRQSLEPLLMMRCLEEVTMVWMEESDPGNYFMGGAGQKVSVGGDWDREYLEDLENERKLLQDALDEAETQRENWKAPIVKLLVEQ